MLPEFSDSRHFFRFSWHRLFLIKPRPNQKMRSVAVDVPVDHGNAPSIGTCFHPPRQSMNTDLYSSVLPNHILGLHKSKDKWRLPSACDIATPRLISTALSYDISLPKVRNAVCELHFNMLNLSLLATTISFTLPAPGLRLPRYNKYICSRRQHRATAPCLQVAKGMAW